MAATLLIGSPETSWREWLKANRGDREFLCLDPGDPIQKVFGRLTLWKGDKIKGWRFYGSADAQRAPHVLIAALAELLAVAKDDVIVQLPDFRPTPLMRQTTLLAAALVKPEKIYVSEGLDFGKSDFVVGPEPVALDAEFPRVVLEANRHAMWLAFLEGMHPHEVSLASVSMEGSRLGSGEPVPMAMREKLRLGHLDWLEICGHSALMIADREPNETEISLVLDGFHCQRAVAATAEQYKGLLCTLARPNEDFAMGVVDEIDFGQGVIRLRANTLAPVPIPILKLGSIRIDPHGRELGEQKPWQV